MEEINEENECSTMEHEGFHRKYHQYPCGCFSFKMGLLAAGATEMALGTAGLALILLSPQKRHMVLYPLEYEHKVEVYSEQWEDTIQLLIEFWLPSLAYWILGAVLVVTAVTRRSSFLVFWILISTLLLAGSVAGIMALIVAGASIIGLLPLILATAVQSYFYLIISDMTYFQWKTSNPKPDDKLILVDTSV